MAREKLPFDGIRESVSAEGVPCEWIIPKDSPPDRALLYLHGGGFVFGLTPLHLQMGAYLAKRMGIRILMVDYRLAPENPFPAALEDCETAYRWLLRSDISARDIVVGGDSAGGNLSLTMVMKLRDSGDPLPSAVACLSPVTDLTPEAHLRTGFKDPLLPPTAIRLYSRSYVGSHDSHHPLISPVFDDLHGLPPMLIHVGEDEILLDDAIRITRLAEAAGVDVRLQVYPRMWHVWQLFLSLPEAVESLGDIAQFLQAHLAHDWQEPNPA